MRVNIRQEVPHARSGSAQAGGDACAEEVRQDEAEARALGISAVPFSVFDMALGASGAQPTQILTSALNQAPERRGRRRQRRPPGQSPNSQDG